MPPSKTCKAAKPNGAGADLSKLALTKECLNQIPSNLFEKLKQGKAFILDETSLTEQEYETIIFGIDEGILSEELVVIRENGHRILRVVVHEIDKQKRRKMGYANYENELTIQNYIPKQIIVDSQTYKILNTTDKS